MKLYKQLAADLTVLSRQDALKPGDRLPSVRETCSHQDPGGHRAIIAVAEGYAYA
ncbi:MAG: hypothetical protein JWO04_6150 [Gammaproteobacteria bacterium]|jgi:DNA-binding transcriptional MocR family regulator|nr:hypothetical protein [Gammaproteobacteria bacterium]